MSKSIAFKSKFKSESLKPKSESESKSNKKGLKSGLESKSGLEYYKSAKYRIQWDTVKVKVRYLI